MTEEMINYIKSELSKKPVSLSESDEIVLRALNEWNYCRDAEKAAKILGKSVPTFYRKKKEFETLYNAGIKYQDREVKPNKNNIFTADQIEKIKSMIQEFPPSELGLQGFHWTGKMLALYIKYNYAVDISIREGQRLLDSKQSRKEKSTKYYQSIIELAKKDNYDIWYFTSQTLFINRRSENKKIKGKVIVGEIRNQAEGIIFAYNPVRNKCETEYFTTYTSNAFNYAVRNLILEMNKYGRRILVVLPYRARYFQTLYDLSERHTEYLRCVIRPRNIQEEEFLTDVKYNIKTDFDQYIRKTGGIYSKRFRITIRDIIRCQFGVMKNR